MLVMDESDYFDASSATADQWDEYTLQSTIPEGTWLIQMGFMLVQPSNDDHGAIFVDNLIASASLPCDYNDLTINMVDSWGDGWNGNVLTINSESFTIEDGSVATGELCLEDGNYTVTCDGGDYQTEVSWNIIDAAGTILLEGGNRKCVLELNT